MSDEDIKHVEQCDFDVPSPPKRARISPGSIDIKREIDEFIPEVPKLSLEAAKELFSKVEKVQLRLDELNEEASEEILAVEQRMNKRRKPHFDDRSKLTAQIPQFWLTALLNHSAISEIVNEEEEECLGYLKNLELEESEDIKSGCTLTFTWYPNRFFENDTIVKEFKVVDLVTTCETSDIVWKIPRCESTSKKPSFFAWLENASREPLDLLDVIREDIYANPVYYFSATEGTVLDDTSDSTISVEDEEEESSSGEVVDSDE